MGKSKAKSKTILNNKKRLRVLSRPIEKQRLESSLQHLKEKSFVNIETKVDMNAVAPPNIEEETPQTRYNRNSGRFEIKKKARKLAIGKKYKKLLKNKRRMAPNPKRMKP